VSDRAEALGLTPVSRETAQRLDILAEQLAKWQRVKNLVSSKAMDTLWTRHIADSLQLLDLVPEAKSWLDLGSGGGFPGLVVAAALAERPGASVILVESNARKCAFLREAARAMSVPAKIVQSRLEDVIEDHVGKVDVVSARALAGLPELVEWTHKLLTTGTVGLFPKGLDLDRELTLTAKCWSMNSSIHNSLTDPSGRILRIHGVTRL
jgi:16S rRNA (guanine527-N7)-methyltransferase